MNPLIDANAAGELLGVPASWVRRAARNDDIPCRRIGRYVRFDLEELRQWADQQARGPKPDQERKAA